MAVRQRREVKDFLIPDDDGRYRGDISSLEDNSSKNQPEVTSFWRMWIVAVAACALVAGYLMSPIEPESQHWVKHVDLTGNLRVNSRLTDGMRSVSVCCGSF